jgi:hypothetical protein
MVSLHSRHYIPRIAPNTLLHLNLYRSWASKSNCGCACHQDTLSLPIPKNRAIETKLKPFSQLLPNTHCFVVGHVRVAIVVVAIVTNAPCPSLSSKTEPKKVYYKYQSTTDSFLVVCKRTLRTTNNLENPNTNSQNSDT